MKTAMGIAMDMGLAGEEEGEDLLTMGDEQMVRHFRAKIALQFSLVQLESIAIDGYLADLPLATFVHNLAFTAAQTNDTSFNAEDFPSGGDAAFPPADMDQHTTSALRDAIFSLNESSGGVATHGEGAGDDHHGGDGPDDPQGMDPHLALLDLSHAMPGEGGPGTGGNDGGGDGLNLPNLSSSTFSSSGCTHQPVVTHILALLTQHPLEQKPGSNTPLTLAVFAPLARSLRLFRALSTCTTCSTSPRETLPQLALLSRTTTILTFPFPPINSSSVGSSAQITVHGARLSGTGLSEAIEQHIVGVVWDSWRAAIREIFATLERKAQEIMTQSAEMSAGENGQPGGNSAETQRAGLMGAMMFQAMSRLVTAMDEVEGN